MIATLTPNPALDLTYEVSRLSRGETHTVSTVRQRAGGKGVNTASVLTLLGEDCLAVCPTGQDDLPILAADLDARGVEHVLVPVGGRVRRTVAVVEPDGAATVFNEPGASWSDSETVDRISTAVRGVTLLAVCGSVPPGSDEAVLEVLRRADARGTRLVLDLRGAVLRSALPLRPALVKPNRAEAAASLGHDPSDPPPAALLAAELVSAGARAAAVSDGARGVDLVAEDGTRVHGVLPEALHGNATGAGDALTAALTMHLARDACRWPEAVRDGVACSAAAVLQPTAGEIDPATVASLRTRVVVEEETA